MFPDAQLMKDSARRYVQSMQPPHSVGIGSDDCTEARSYNCVLGQSVPELIEGLLVRKEQVRLLDIGSGNGQALADIASRFADHPKRDALTLRGIDLEPYPDTICSNVFSHHPKTGNRYDLVMSAFCAQYIPEKLELVEFVHNHLLKMGGIGLIHLPDELVVCQEDVLRSQKPGLEYFLSLAGGSVSFHSNGKGQQVIRMERKPGVVLHLPLTFKSTYPVPGVPSTALMSVYERDRK